MQLPVHPEWAHLPLIDYLALLWPDRSRRALEGLFGRGRVRSGGRPAASRGIVGELRELTLQGSLDDVEKIPCDPGHGDAVPMPAVIHEDSRLVALSKPSGVPVVPDRTRRGGSCLGFLLRRELEARAWKPPSDWIRYRIVHRIDLLTSGLVLVARTAEAERALAADFEGRRVLKEYLALLSGAVLPARFSVNCPIVPGRKGRMRAEAPGGRLDSGGSALTEFDVLERWEGVTLVRARPRTGRTHQIRVHAWAAGHPLAIDPVYGGTGGRPQGIPPPGIERLTLHAHRYELPETWDLPRTFECPLPADFEEALARLRAPAP